MVVQLLEQAREGAQTYPQEFRNGITDVRLRLTSVLYGNNLAKKFPLKVEETDSVAYKGFERPFMNPEHPGLEVTVFVGRNEGETQTFLLKANVHETGDNARKLLSETFVIYLDGILHIDDSDFRLYINESSGDNKTLKYVSDLVTDLESPAGVFPAVT